MAFPLVDGFLPVLRLGDNCNVRPPPDHRGQTIANDGVIVSEQN